MRERAIAKTILLLMGLTLGAPGFANYSEADFAQVISAKEKRIDQLRNKEINQLQLVLSRNVPNEQQPDMLLRLAELFTEKYRLYFLQETEIWQKKMDAYLQHPVSEQKRMQRPVLDKGASQQWLSRAVSALEKILSVKQRYEKMDEVYYFLGFNQSELGRKRESARYFSQITDHYPQSRYATEAYRYLADFAFADRDFSRAAKYYKKASSIDSPSKPRVLYGLAWSQFKLRDNRSATKTMHDAIASAKGQGTDAAAQGIALQRDAFDALALFYSQSNDADGASEYFNSLLNKSDAIDALHKLAGNYQRQGRFSQALAINKQLVDMGASTQKGGDEQRYAIMQDSVRVASSSGDRDRESALLKTLVAEFVVKAKDPDEARVEQIRIMVRRAAMLAHQEANKAKKPKPIFARAEDLYRLYLSAFGSNLKPEEVWELHYLLADVLSQQGKNAEAAQEFQTILTAAEKDPSNASLKKYQKDSAVGLIFSIDAALKQEKQQLSVEESNQLVMAVETYARLYPREKDVPKYLARASGVLVTSKRMSEARPRLEYLARNYSTSKEGLDAAILLVKDAEQAQAWDRVAKLSAEFLHNPGLMSQDKKGDLRKQLEDVQSRAQFKEVKTLEEGQNFAGAAAQYEALAAKSKDREIRYKALNNAAVTYQKAGDTTNELRVYETMIKLFPDDSKAPQALLGLGNTAFVTGDFANAAAFFERYFTAYEMGIQKASTKKQQDTFLVLRNAAYLREATGQANEANEDLKRIVTWANKGVASARDIAEEVLARSADRMHQLGDKVESLRAYQRYIQSFPDGRFAAEANVQAGLIYQELREDDKAKLNFDKAIQIARKRGKSADAKTLSAGAHARLELLKANEENFYRLPLRLPESTLKADIGVKLKAMDGLVKAFVEVVDFGDGTWGVEALSRMANVYRSFAESLEKAPVPAEFSPEDKAKFKAQLKQVAGPVYQKMNETFENALRTGENLFVAGPTMARVYLSASLATARTDRLPLAYELSWNGADNWLTGEIPESEEALKNKRELLKNQPENANAWVAIGNWYLRAGKFDLGRIFYLRALEANKKSVAAVANLAYIEGKEGNWQAALAGYRTAMEYDEFAIQPRKNLARIYMASGLWRHANLAYRQLEVRAPADIEVKRGIALSSLASGKSSQAEGVVAALPNDTNGEFAKAILLLAKGKAAEAHTQINDLASKSEFAQLVAKGWKQ